MEKPKRRSRLSSNNLLILLLSLIFLLLGVPLLENVVDAGTLWRLGLTAVTILAAVATQRRKLLLGLGLLAVAVTAPMNWLTMSIQNHSLFLASCTLDAIFFAIMATMILTAVIKKHLATIDSIYGAICAYLLYGLAWSMLYLGLSLSPAGDWTILGAKFDLERSRQEVSAFSQIIYFSFVTMSSLGYGDLVPSTVLVRTLSWMQSVFGQFYIAVLVAWLVSEIPRRQHHENLEHRLNALEVAQAVKPATSGPAAKTPMDSGRDEEC